MNTLLVFLWIILAFIAMAFWEAYIEGRNPWASAEVGWRKRLSKRITLTAYHFWLFVMFFFLLSLPLIANGWDKRLFGVILSAFSIGLIVEDLMWFAANPFYSFRKFNPKDAYWYPWIRIWRLELPAFYLIGFASALASWHFFWR